jgi:hypothetical protein
MVGRVSATYVEWRKTTGAVVSAGLARYFFGDRREGGLRMERTIGRGGVPSALNALPAIAPPPVVECGGAPSADTDGTAETASNV